MFALFWYVNVIFVDYNLEAYLCYILITGCEQGRVFRTKVIYQEIDDTVGPINITVGQCHCPDGYYMNDHNECVPYVGCSQPGLVYRKPGVALCNELHSEVKCDEISTGKCHCPKGKYLSISQECLPYEGTLWKQR